MTARRLPLRAAATLAALVAAQPAVADDTWRSLAATADDERIRLEYERAMNDGDDAVSTAVSASLLSDRLRLIDRAIASYELAARARPDQAEPHFRAASVIRIFDIDCRPMPSPQCPEATPARRARLIEHWDAFERLAPGDPRIAEDVLFERAVNRTKLGTDADLAAARDDYRKLLELRPDSELSNVLGNLAETYMMLGDLDRAIETYRRTIATGADLSQEFGMAVALDRDEQGSQARAIIAARGEGGVARFQLELRSGHIFFVPPGEELYYLALAAEALGDVSSAIELWDGFIASGAHPQFADRARHNRDVLLRRGSERRPTVRRPRRPPAWNP